MNVFNLVSGSLRSLSKNQRTCHSMKLIISALCALILCVIFVTITTQNVISKSTITVNIPGQGAVLGNYDTTSWTNQSFMQFRGIPYAESPRGKLRFKAPVPRLPWRQIHDATKFGRRCPVITTISTLSPAELQEDLEDCLNLCVYTKNLTAKLPVMFYMYGGGFYNGTAADHPPHYLLEEDIVVVVPHYRIGALGWLSTRTNSLPGNVPIADLLLALEWVQNNIEAFGGSRDNVTIFGQSAGAALASSLLISPKTSSGLFHKALIQSGSMFNHWAINKYPYEQAERICKALDCGSCSTVSHLQRCFAKVTVPQLLAVTKDEFFSPITHDAIGLLPQNPNELIQNYNKAIPVMTGFTKHDGSFVLAIYYDDVKKKIPNIDLLTVRQFASGMLGLANDTTLLTNNLMLRLLFTPELLESRDHKAAIPAYFDLTNTQFIKSGTIALTSHLRKRSRAQTYFYSFDYEGEHSRFGYENGEAHYPFNGGVHHSNDNIYIWATHKLNANDTEMAKRMVRLWTTFAKFGTPNLGESMQMLPMQTENGPYFHINTEITIGQDVLQEFTTTLDDPNNKDLDRENIDF